MKIYFNSTFIETKRETDDLFVKGNNGNVLQAYFEDLDLSNVNINLRLVIGWSNNETTNELPMNKSYDNAYAHINLPTLKYDGNTKFTIKIYQNETLFQTAIFTRNIKETVESNDSTNITSAEYQALLNQIKNIDDKANANTESIENLQQSGDSNTSALIKKQIQTFEYSNESNLDGASITFGNNIDFSGVIDTITAEGTCTVKANNKSFIATGIAVVNLGDVEMFTVGVFNGENEQIFPKVEYLENWKLYETNTTDYVEIEQVELTNFNFPTLNGFGSFMDFVQANNTSITIPKKESLSIVLKDGNKFSVPVDQFAKQTQVNNQEQRITQLEESGANVDLSNYYNKQETSDLVNTEVKNLEQEIDNYYLKKPKQEELVADGQLLLINTNGTVAPSTPTINELAFQSDVDNIKNAYIKSVGYNIQTGIFTFTKQDGTIFEVDLAIEKVVANFEYNSETQSLELTLADGTVQSIPLVDFISAYEGVENDYIQVVVQSGNKIQAILKDGSITLNKLSQEVKDIMQNHDTKLANTYTKQETSDLIDDEITNAKTEISDEQKIITDALDEKIFNNSEDITVLQSNVAQNQEQIGALNEKSTDHENRLVALEQNQGSGSGSSISFVQEEVTIDSTSWASLADKAPYTYFATLTLTNSLDNATSLELINNNPVLFSTYGFAIGEIVDSNVIIVYSIGQPSASVVLTLEMIVQASNEKDGYTVNLNIDESSSTMTSETSVYLYVNGEKNDTITISQSGGLPTFSDGTSSKTLTGVKNIYVTKSTGEIFSTGIVIYDIDGVQYDTEDEDGIVDITKNCDITISIPYYD